VQRNGNFLANLQFWPVLAGIACLYFTYHQPAGVDQRLGLESSEDNLTQVWWMMLVEILIEALAYTPTLWCLQVVWTISQHGG
jgi:hypothetical protein